MAASMNPRDNSLSVSCTYDRCGFFFQSGALGNLRIFPRQQTSLRMLVLVFQLLCLIRDRTIRPRTIRPNWSFEG